MPYMSNQTSTSKSGGRGAASLFAIWIILYFAIRLYLEANPEISSGARVALAFLPTPVFGFALIRFIREMQAADELERRIQLEALAVAFPLGLLLLTTLGLVQRAVTLRFEDWSYNHVWPMFALFYLAGLMIARRRYS
jgi:hypothetical protein